MIRRPPRSTLFPLPLVTEALRGEGAWLVDETGVRFMPDVHERAELAPRDVVARAIWGREMDGHTVFLDARASVGEAFPERFPTVWEHCRRQGLDPRHEPIPVTPAAHYAMAGVATDACGRTSLPGLWACGEVASSGVHGANRLASNSLLEALVFGARAAADAGAWASSPRAAEDVVWREPVGEGRVVDGLRARIRRLTWEKVGLVRDGAGLRTALAELRSLAAPATPAETANLLTLARLVTAAALERRESRGAHYRTDFPEPRAAEAHRRFWTYRPEGELPIEPAGEAIREIA